MNKVDQAINRAVADYASECEAARISRDLGEQRRRVDAVVSAADPLDVLGSDYFGAMTMDQSIMILQAAVLSVAGHSLEDEPTPAPKPRKSKKKDVE